MEIVTNPWVELILENQLNLMVALSLLVAPLTNLLF